MIKLCLMQEFGITNKFFKAVQVSRTFIPLYLHLYFDPCQSSFAYISAEGHVGVGINKKSVSTLN
jgi:hypothetical protein